MEKINPDYKQPTWKIKAKRFNIRKPVLQVSIVTTFPNTLKFNKNTYDCDNVTKTDQN